MPNIFKFIFTILLGLTIHNYSFAESKNYTQNWSTSEHLASGNKLKLYFCKQYDSKCTTGDFDIKSVPDVLLSLDNGLVLTFSEILTMSGDYFAVANEPITGDLYDNLLGIQENNYDKPQKKIDLEQLKKLTPRFNKAFNTLAKDWGADYKVNLVFKYLTGSLSLEEAISLGLERYDLAIKNYDHFAPYSWYAYSVGHYLALNLAANAGSSHDQSKLKYAYAVEAYAQHYLTDTFSSGHIRVPLKQLQRFSFFEKNALLLTKFMHDEDAKFGINLYNQRGDYWRAYGDDNYNDERNQNNVIQLQKIQQMGISQIFYVYLNYGMINYGELYEELSEYLPMLNNNDSLAEHLQTSALFTSDDYDNIYRRYDINTLLDKDTQILSQFGAMTLLIQKLLTYDPQ